MVFWRIEEVPSAKAHRVSERKKINNQPIRTKARSSIAKVRNLISQGELEAAEESLGDVYKALDKAAQKGVIHHKNASRRKSRIVKTLNKAKNVEG
ncbi:MAG: 30S ribosomal protein S20 [Chloroflexi bacterium]|nr:30S ribosomal protein S20 [Chloroflexota bacterium]|tara:strand:+ start:626 stop:913 length:288 start_codon:yes stop_codon:yes gene_type:complete